MARRLRTGQMIRATRHGDGCTARFVGTGQTGAVTVGRVFDGICGGSVSPRASSDKFGQLSLKQIPPKKLSINTF